MYIDDILVGSQNVEEHEQHLREVFTRLRENCLTMNLEKCTLAQPTVTFLGHTVDAEGIRPLPEKVTTIKQFPLPSLKLDVQYLLGMVNFYHRFHPRIAHIARPLMDSLSKAKKDFTITPEMITAINQVKDPISKATLLVHP